MRIGIVGNRDKDPGGVVARDLTRWLTDRGVTVLVDEDFSFSSEQDVTEIYEWPDLGVDFVVVLGGDGTLLRAARKTASLPMPLLGVNLGHLGFLTELEAADMYEVLPRFLRGSYVRDSRHFVQARVRDEDGEVSDEYLALNDVVVSKGDVSRMVNVHTWVDDELMAVYPSDGVILSTATGSTAYSLSAGGPVVHPELEVIVVTPVCPHTFYARPVVLSRRQTVRVHVEARFRGVPMITVDGDEGRHLRPEETVEASISEQTVTLLRRPEWNFYEVLRQKLSQSEGRLWET